MFDRWTGTFETNGAHRSIDFGSIDGSISGCLDRAMEQFFLNHTFAGLGSGHQVKYVQHMRARISRTA